VRSLWNNSSKEMGALVDPSCSVATTVASSSVTIAA
jgi:hypothetical protein